MTKMQHFHKTLVFVDYIIDKDGTVQQLAYARSFSNCASHPGKTDEQIHVVE